MKQLINPEQRPSTIKLEDLPARPIFGILACGEKYVPSFCNDNGKKGLPTFPTFAGGKDSPDMGWSSGRTIEALFKATMAENNVVIYTFENTKELAAWLLEE